MKPTIDPLRHLIAAAVVVATGFGLAACGSSDAKPVAETADARVPVETVLPSRQDWVRTWSGTATLSAERAATLVSETGGEVVQILVEEGDRVVAGQVLARIDGERARLTLAQSASVTQRLEHEATRSERLLARHMVAADAAERTRFERDAQRAATDLAALGYAKREIRAPYAGVVTRRHIKRGQWLSANAAAFDIADFNDLVADVAVPEKELAGLKPGQPVSIEADAFRDGAFIGEVERIGAVVDGASGTATVRIDVNERDTPLRPGQFVRIAIEREHLADALLLPKAAVVFDEAAAASVVAVRDGKAEHRRIALGGEQDGFVRVTDGLSEGTPVVRIGQSQLSDGDAVVVVNHDTATAAATASAP